MEFDFSADKWSGLTRDRVTKLVTYFPLTIIGLEIWNSNFGFYFMKLIHQISLLCNLNFLDMKNSVVGDEEEGEELGTQLAYELSSNDSIKFLCLWNTDLLGSSNVKEWGDYLLKNSTLIDLSLRGVKTEIVSELKERLKNHVPHLDIY